MQEIKIKKIADMYGIEYVALDLEEIYFAQNNAIRMIEKLRFECCPIIGVDVCLLKDGYVEEFLMPNLSTDRANNESCREYLLRSCDEAIEFIRNYPYKCEDLFYDICII
ncbi:MAG: hypothetical protein IKQ72_09945 [Bacteroidaceae bacterium]|nr:hypothetical protein [Bacteroidaceae bacterium]